MKSVKKAAALLTTILILSLGTTGCWNRRELPNLGIVMGAGLDKNEDSGKLEVTAQLIKTSELNSGGTGEGGGGGSGDSRAYWNLQNTGEGMFATIRGFTHKSSRKLYWPHNQVIIFGHSLAEQGIQEYLDFFVRDQETRLEVYMLVAQDKASEILDFQPKLEKIPAVGISELMESQSANSQTCVTQLNEFVTRLMSPTTAPIAPIIKIEGQGANSELSVEGTAVFKKDKLIGQLTKEETRGLLWAINKVKSGIIKVRCPDCQGIASLEIIRSKGKITSQIIDSKPSITIEIEEEGNIGDQSCDANLVAPDAAEKLTKQAEKAILDEVESALKKSQKLKADIFGFGDIFHQRHLKEWTQMKDDWDEIYSNLDVEITVQAKIRRSGLIGRPATPEKEQ
ncbi:Ger(x)C family spore germination protein [Desulfosporosinus meridiei]|uniref:Germination protein, Ger(X)C family n=1 Tax=Desulfosporosinus meridiei (strain ATCC BAA-275 / DSM 13257 / KCTC 12902 / NCIMB 13706 / S10) TaxID=768704 RepID=J7INN4_DESMD|nr:Ger(x)C family spore germination protein [Desulfosporosinus meridiei]AFQ43432.1 germination protein, Ger(X)C family [Desulfosporosinus meridiei DSM 13257]